MSMPRKTFQQFGPVKVIRIKRRPSQRSFTNRYTKSWNQNNQVSIIHVKVRPTIYAPDTTAAPGHSLTPRKEAYSAPIITDTSKFTKPNTQFSEIIITDGINIKRSSNNINMNQSQGNTTLNTSGANGNKSFNLTIESEKNLRKDAWSSDIGKKSSSNRYNATDWKAITEEKKRKKFKCSGKICCCHPYLCYLITALCAIALLAAIVLALVFTLIKQQTTTTSISTTETSITTTTPVLLINPGGELGSLSSWTSVSSSFPMLDNGTANGGNTPPYNGLFDLYGGPANGSLHQKVSLTSLFSTTQLDSGLLVASISFWEKTTSATILDTAEVSLIFLSATNNTLSSVTTGPQACVLAWCYATSNWSLPVGTRTIDYVMTFVLNYGTMADAWIDDNILDVY